MKIKHNNLWSIFVLTVMLNVFFLSSCDNESNVIAETVYKGNDKYTIRETNASVNGEHQISTFVTNNSGMGVIIDGDFKYYDDYGIRYRPVVSNNGNYAWVQQMKGVGYEIIWQGESILRSGACFDFLTASSTKAICVESDTGQSLTKVYLIDMATGNCQCIARLNKEYIEDACRYGVDKFGIITCKYDSKGSKLYNVYAINWDETESGPMQLVEEESQFLVFPKIAKIQNSDNLLVDYLKMSSNERYLYNALSLYEWGGQNCDAFAYWNDCRGRLAWDVSYRIRGLCELFKKTQNTIIKKRLHEVVNGVLNARNGYTGIIENQWTPAFLWASKCYTIGDVPACIMAENCELLSALLYACNEGLLKNKEVISTAERAFEYYESFYNEGHYKLPYGFPTSFDGIVVPWNYQNSMAEVCLGLYIETGKQKYLNRCNELLSSFKDEWHEDADRIYWHYWPLSFYEGWENDGRSMNTPSRDSMTDNLYEDASHAGISARLICRYVENVPNGEITKNHVMKIESNMKYFCYKDGFSRFISGNVDYSPKAWSYWVSPYFSYLHNEEFEQYVCQGYLKCFPQWDSQGSLFANSKLFDSNIVEKPIEIVRKRIDLQGQETLESMMLSITDLYQYVVGP